ncbi:MAG: hypothetical protein A2Y38_07660 [Spirochaetes bacterium GWB1_59_5]|nr:MAG: hypothetical protein A2Y38_07660 [Spirochaetes bacterium GWB1_59_5]
MTALLLRIILTTSPAGTEADVQALARYDAVAFSYRAPAAQRAAIRALRLDQVQLCFVGSMNLSQTWGTGYWEAAARETCEARAWWVVDLAGDRVIPWDGEWAIDLTEPACREWYARTLVDQVLTAYGFDGLILDQVHRGISHMAPAGLPFTDETWAAAVTDMVISLRSLAGIETILIANGSLLPSQAPDLDAAMLEGYGWMPPLRDDWAGWAVRYDALAAVVRRPEWMIVTSATEATFRQVYSTALSRGCFFATAPWSGTAWREEYESSDWWPVKHFVFGVAPGTYCVTQGDLSLGRASDAGGVLTFTAPAAFPISVVACAAGMRPSVAILE